METDFLTEPTRKLRKSLLVASLIGFAISYAGLRVSEVSLLGSKLSITRFEVIPLVLGIVVLYFLVTFIIFGLYDYSQSHLKLRNDYLEAISKGEVYSKHEIKIAIQDLEGELTGLESNQTLLGVLQPPEEAVSDRDRILEIKKEMIKLKRVWEFYRSYKGSIFERLRLRGMKIFFDLFVPIFIGFYVAILLFFFTKIPELNDTTHKPEQDIIISEKVMSNDANQVTSDSLIESPETGEQK